MIGKHNLEFGLILNKKNEINTNIIARLNSNLVNVTQNGNIMSENNLKIIGNKLHINATVAPNITHIFQVFTAINNNNNQQS